MTLAGANMAVIHLAAHGAIDSPELGRVSVSARDGEVGVDVQIVAEKKGSADILLPHAGAMEADVRTANVSVHRLEITSGPLADDPMSGRGNASGGGSNPNETSERPAAPGLVEPSPDAEIAPARARVRIVL